MTPPPELLAPAGGFDAACAAFTYGADAVYLGLPRFSARAEAENFTAEQFGKIVGYARSFAVPKKIYATLNTLVWQGERPALLEALGTLAAVEVDGVIVQDLGLADLLRRNFPRIPLHASTQLACHSTAGAQALKAQGFARVVTARELTFAEAAQIGRSAGIEIEVFIHGALCYSYSGLCLFSALATGRSGNRGRCAYCCRDAFTPVDADGRPLQAGTLCHPFSMRDLATLESLKDIDPAAIASLKIEGRMKSPLYVAAVTDLYRHALDADLPPAELEKKAADLRTVFSRPWTPLYTDTRARESQAVIDPLGMGHRGERIGTIEKIIADRDRTRWLCFTPSRPLEKHDGIQIDLPSGGRPVGFAIDRMRAARSARLLTEAPAGAPLELALPPDLQPLPLKAPLFCSASQAVRRQLTAVTPRDAACRLLRPVDVRVTLAPHGLTATGGDPEAHAAVAAQLTPARNPRETEAAVAKAFARMGDDGWSVARIHLDDPLRLYAPPSQLNALRRALAQALAEARDRRLAARLQSISLIEPQTAPQPVAAPRFHLRLAPDAPPGLLSGEAPESLILALSPATRLEALAPWFDRMPRDRIRFALPVILRDPETAPFTALIRTLRETGFQRFEVAGLAGLHLLSTHFTGLEISADWTWYATNAEALRAQRQAGILRAVTSPEDPVSNILQTAGCPQAPLREILLYQHTPLFISETRPVTPSGADSLRNRHGQHYTVSRLQQRWITASRQPWSRLETLHLFLASGYGDYRLDLSWQPARSLKPAPWRSLCAPPV